MSQQEVIIECQLREGVGTNDARRLRHAKTIPAVVYGGGRDPQPVVVDPRPIELVLESETGLNTLIHLRVSGRDLRRMVLIRQVQRHPVTERLLHCDFLRVEMDQPIDVAVPLAFVGVPEGVKNEGGVVQYIHREINVRVLPSKIPAHIDVDISALHTGQHLEAGDVPLPEGCELLMPPGETLCTVVGKGAEETAAAPEGGEAAGTTPETT
ncbi:MAG: 50S ribosomal protein L25 [Acidobacteria bacterium]|nr:50S ribosomal protein L25 [Acidobacteriota bacterium]